MTAEIDNEVWLKHNSCESWCDPDRWVTYFECVQGILGAEVSHLDDNDPIRRTAQSLKDASEFVTRFGPPETSRWVFGELRDRDIGFSIWLTRESSGDQSTISWHAPAETFCDPLKLHQICRLFDAGNELLDSYYGYADTRGEQKRKKKQTGAVDFETELIGVFWLTFFNARYASFFGREKIEALTKLGISVEFGHGATLRLSSTPSEVPGDLRREAELHLGKYSFVNPDPKDFTVKRPGQFALTYDQLVS